MELVQPHSKAWRLPSPVLLEGGLSKAFFGPIHQVLHRGNSITTSTRVISLFFRLLSDPYRPLLSTLHFTSL